MNYEKMQEIFKKKEKNQKRLAALIFIISSWIFLFFMVRNSSIHECIKIFIVWIIAISLDGVSKLISAYIIYR